MAKISHRRWREQEPGLTASVRDFGAEPLPHPTTERLPGLAGTGDSDAAKLADMLVAELKAADVLEIGAPGGWHMHRT